MLPFLAKIKQPGISSTITREPDLDKEGKDQGNQGLEACAKQLIDAIESKDAKMVAQALKDAYSLCDSYDNQESYDEQDTE